MELVKTVMQEMASRDLSAVPVIAGGIIPLEDAAKLKALGLKAVYTPKDFDFNMIMGDMVDIIRKNCDLKPFGPLP